MFVLNNKNTIIKENVGKKKATLKFKHQFKSKKKIIKINKKKKKQKNSC